MKTLIKYSLHDYLRSHKYFPPVSTFIILIVVFYSYKPNPISDSYAVTAIITYIISAWLCISVLSLDTSVERQLMILQVGGRKRYYLSKLISVLLLALLLTLYAFIYPIIFGMFDESVSITIGLVSIINHIFLSILGISVASLFSKIITENVINSYGGLVLTIIFSLAAIGVYNVMPPYFRNIVWIIPPATSTQTPLINWNGENILDLSFFPFIWIIIYSFLILILFLNIAKRLK